MKTKRTQAAVDFMAQERVGDQLRMLDRAVTSVYEGELRPLTLTPSSCHLRPPKSGHSNSWNASSEVGHLYSQCSERR